MKDIDKGYVCPHCNSFVKQYRRSFNSNIAVALLTMYRHAPNMFVKVEDLLIKSGKQRCGDFSYARFYRLIEPQQGTRNDGSKRTGYYRLTALGVMFCEGKTTVPEKFLILHNTLQGFEGAEINIHQALGNKFSYAELMGKTETNLTHLPQLFT